MSDTKYDDFGSILRAERERLGISLRQISTSTNLSMATLEALERNDISSLAGGIFVRSFVRAYAAEVGLDPEETVRKFLAQCPVEGAHTGSPYADESNDYEAFQSQRQAVTTVAVLLLLSVPIVGSFLLAGFCARTEQLPALASGVGVVTATAAVPDPEGESDLKPTHAPGVAEASLVGKAASDLALTINIHPRADCWISLTLDGRRMFSKIMRAGERSILEAEREIIVTVGDAGAFMFTINKHPGRSLGQDGEVVTARINRDNYRNFLAE